MLYKKWNFVTFIMCIWQKKILHVGVLPFSYVIWTVDIYQSFPTQKGRMQHKVKFSLTSTHPHEYPKMVLKVCISKHFNKKPSQQNSRLEHKTTPRKILVGIYKSWFLFFSDSLFIKSLRSEILYLLNNNTVIIMRFLLGLYCFVINIFGNIF